FTGAGFHDVPVPQATGAAVGRSIPHALGRRARRALCRVGRLPPRCRLRIGPRGRDRLLRMAPSLRGDATTDAPADNPAGTTRTLLGGDVLAGSGPAAVAGTSPFGARRALGLLDLATRPPRSGGRPPAGRRRRPPALASRPLGLPSSPPVRPVLRLLTTSRCDPRTLLSRTPAPTVPFN